MRGTRQAGRVAAALLACGIAGSSRAEDSVSPEAAEDARILVENAVAVARGHLADDGNFDPFAFFVDSEGKLQRVSPRQGAVLPEPAEILELLAQTFRDRAEAGGCRAIAVVADVVIALPGGGRSEALQVGVEHSEGYCVNFFHPYERVGDGALRFGQPISSRRTGVVFTACNR